ncbi:hypothetical protein VNO78_26288 [Psophocarpus tetragonolobus]|uniref:Uncharacterized protein n=1 Tax=Psophocarpus tetragonolobus TaxID=3891 RepID=A0AAN9RZL3_PSOTE
MGSKASKVLPDSRLLISRTNHKPVPLDERPHNSPKTLGTHVPTTLGQQEALPPIALKHHMPSKVEASVNTIMIHSDPPHSSPLFDSHSPSSQSLNSLHFQVKLAANFPLIPCEAWQPLDRVQLHLHH